MDSNKIIILLRKCDYCIQYESGDQVCLYRDKAPRIIMIDRSENPISKFRLPTIIKALGLKNNQELMNKLNNLNKN